MILMNKIILGITGGSGTGKSTVLSALRSFGAYTIDADLTARRITEAGSAALFEIKEHFGNGVIAPDGSLFRKKLGDIVFSDKNELRILNEITHKYIKEDILNEINQANNPLTVIEAAELHLGGLAEICTATVAVLADREIRKKRIMKRDKLTSSQAENRISAQKSDEYYKEITDYQIYNNNDPSIVIDELKKIIDEIGGR